MTSISLSLLIFPHGYSVVISLGRTLNRKSSEITEGGMVGISRSISVTVWA